MGRYKDGCSKIGAPKNMSARINESALLKIDQHDEPGFVVIVFLTSMALHGPIKTQAVIIDGYNDGYNNWFNDGYNDGHNDD